MVIDFLGLKFVPISVVEPLTMTLWGWVAMWGDAAALVAPAEIEKTPTTPPLIRVSAATLRAERRAMILLSGHFG
jgi:hypothetical protein